MADFDELLTLTSRTFGLSIPLLEQPHRRRLTLAYLLFRVADTLEDSEHPSFDERAVALRNLRHILVERNDTLATELSRQWVDWRPSSHAGYLKLLAATPELIIATRELQPPYNQLIVHHVCRTIDGMLEFVDRGRPAGALQTRSLEELRRYCYVVAGIVGELITALFVTASACLEPVADELQQEAARFGEGLQLANILRDTADDARFRRFYLPADVSPEDLFALAREDLRNAEKYVAAVRRCDPGQGMVPFIEFPLRLAFRTLDSVQSEGPGAKLSRREVAEILQQVDGRFESAEALPVSLRNFGVG